MRPKVSAPEGSPYGVRMTLRRSTSRLESWVSPLPPMMASMLFLHGADFREIPPKTLRVHAAAEHEAVGDAQPDEIGADRLLGMQCFLHQHRAIHALGA